ncbi:MAG: AAA family ATPase [Thermoleophilaceae bacterium]
MGTTIRLCGPLVVEIDGRRIEGRLPGRQGRLLFAYLAANHDRPTSRGDLTELLWPFQAPAAPDAALNTLLARLRRSVGTDVLVGRGHLGLRLPGELWIDLDAAHRFAREADAGLAESRYRSAGEAATRALDILDSSLLPEFEGPWLDEQRRELDELKLDLLEALARVGLNLGGTDLPTAERAARALVERAPYREAGHAVLMETLAQRGNVAEALRAFERLRVLLREELGATPTATVTALHQQLLQTGGLGVDKAPSLGPTVSGQPRPLPLPGPVARSEQKPFIGRTPQLDRLRACWRQAQRLEAPTVLLTGEPGIGKTRLAARLAAEAHAEAGAVLYGRADEETVVPYQPFVEALRHYAAHAPPEPAQDPARAMVELGALVPELGGTGHQLGVGLEAAGEERENHRYRLFEAVLALFARVSTERPLLLVIEDLHWADKPTLLLFRHLVRNLEGRRVMLLATYRDVEVGTGDPLSRLTSDLRRDHVIRRVSLEGLEETEAAALISARAEPRASQYLSQALLEHTGGNPFYIEEILRELSEVALASNVEVDPEQTLNRLGVPEGVRDVIVRRFERLAEPARDLLTTASALGRDFRLRTLQAVVDAPSDDMLLALEEALRAGLLVEVSGEADRFSFCHALVRTTLYELQTRSRRVRLHQRVALALELRRRELEVHPAALAHHFFEARALGGDEQAITYSFEAGQLAREAHAYEDAAAHYERALGLLGTRAEAEVQRCEALLELGGARWQASEPGARAAFGEAAEIARRHGADEYLARAVLGAGGRFYAPRIDHGYVAQLENALTALATEDGPLGVRLTARLAEGLALSDPARAQALGSRATETARRLDDRGALLAALMGQHAALLHAENLAARLGISEELLSMTVLSTHEETAALGRHWQLYDLFELGDLDRARHATSKLDELADELQQPLYRHSTIAWRGVWAQLRGDLVAAQALADEARRLSEQAGTEDARIHFVEQLLVIRRDQGRLSELLPDLEDVVSEDPSLMLLQAAMPLVLLEANKETEATSAFDRLADDDCKSVPRNLFWLPALAWLAEAAARLGDDERARTLYRVLEPYADRMAQATFTGSLGSVDHFLGLLAATNARWQTARRHLESAIAKHRALDAPLLLARSLQAYGHVLRQTENGGECSQAQLAEEIERLTRAANHV